MSVTSCREKMLARDVWRVTARATPLDNVIDVTVDPVAPEDRRPVRDEAASHGARRRFRPAQRADVMVLAPSVPGTPHAVARRVLALVICVFCGRHPPLRESATVSARWTSRSAPTSRTIEKVYHGRDGRSGEARSPDGHHALSGRRRQAPCCTRHPTGRRAGRPP